MTIMHYLFCIYSKNKSNNILVLKKLTIMFYRFSGFKGIKLLFKCYCYLKDNFTFCLRV